MEMIIIASGKGGAGKTSLCAGVSSYIALSGKTVLAIDGDVGLRNLDIVFDMTDRLVFSFKDVALGLVSLDKARVRHPKMDNLHVLTSPMEMENLIDIEKLINQARDYDYIIVDMPAGTGSIINLFARYANKAIIVTTPETVSIRGATAVCEQIENNNCCEIYVVVNRIRTEFIKYGKAYNIDDVMDQVGLPLIGIIPEDEDVISCSNLGKNIMIVKDTGASKAYKNIAKRLLGEKAPIMKI